MVNTVPPQFQVAGAVEFLRLESSRGGLQAGSSIGLRELAIGLSVLMSQDHSVHVSRSCSCSVICDVFSHLLIVMLRLMLLRLLRLQTHKQFTVDCMVQDMDIVELPVASKVRAKLLADNDVLTLWHDKGRQLK